MKKMNKYLQSGFSLIEMMLVAAIIGGIIYMGIGYTQQRTSALMIDRASAQMQQILNAGLSYYVSYGSWPANIAALQTGNYLPATVVSPWATSYTLSNTTNILTVKLSLPAGLKNSKAIAQMIAGKLPFGVATTSTPPPPSTSIISASVNIPAQNLNNVGNVSYTGVYHSGACVPVPTCPTTSSSGVTLTPEIQVVPVSFSGMYDAGSTTVYPITSITASVSGPSADLAAGTGPAICGNDTDVADTSCYADATLENPLTYSNPGPSRGRVAITTGTYWRVCLFVNTQAGEVTWDSLTGNYASVLAMTRCKVSTETAGSTMNVWGY